MRLRQLSLRHFRNLGVQEVTVPPEGAALVGENAQGKTNLLEAIYYLETFRSFRGARDDQLVAFGEEAFRIVAGLEDEECAPRPTLTAAFQRSGRRKKVTVEGREPERLSDALGRLAAVVFSPADVSLINEGPAERRRFLDIVLSLNAEGYLGALQEYRHILSQRNAALKEDQSADMVGLWDDGLVRAGARVMYERARWIEGWGDAFTAFYVEVSGGQGAVQSYKPSVRLDGETTLEGMATAFGEALADSAGRERRLGTTVVGPHRDELSISLEGERDLEVREFGSGGQRRTAALALRLTEARTIREARGQEPLVLLDDVFAELDQGRGERILALIEREETGQVILTAPKESDVRLRKDVLPRWHIAGGRIQT